MIKKDYWQIETSVAVLFQEGISKQDAKKHFEHALDAFCKSYKQSVIEEIDFDEMIFRRINILDSRLEELCIKYPLVFGGKRSTDQLGEALAPESSKFYFECDHGWSDLLDNLCSKIEEALKKLSEEQRSEMHVAHIKEKFGGLRFYMSSATNEIDDLIEAAENDSYNVCESCGTRENVSTKGQWIKTYCDSCRRSLKHK